MQGVEDICQTANFVLFNLFVMSGLCRTKNNFAGSQTGWYFETQTSFLNMKKYMYVGILITYDD